jgi:hypothetical protein
MEVVSPCIALSYMALVGRMLLLTDHCTQTSSGAFHASVILFQRIHKDGVFFLSKFPSLGQVGL